MDEGNRITLHLTFASPAEAEEAGDSLEAMGFRDIRLYVCLDATATGTDAELQEIHDRLKVLFADKLDASANQG